MLLDKDTYISLFNTKIIFVYQFTIEYIWKIRYQCLSWFKSQEITIESGGFEQERSKTGLKTGFYGPCIMESLSEFGPCKINFSIHTLLKKIFVKVFSATETCVF